MAPPGISLALGRRHWPLFKTKLLLMAVMLYVRPARDLQAVDALVIIMVVPLSFKAALLITLSVLPLVQSRPLVHRLVATTVEQVAVAA